jgi:hypothetical protein
MLRAIALTALLLTASAAERTLHPRDCRAGRIQYLDKSRGHASWSDNGAGAFVGRSEERSQLELPLVCTVNLGAAATGVSLLMGDIRIAFGRGAYTGSGVIVSLTDPKRGLRLWSKEALRTGAEDWLEIPGRSYSIFIPQPISSLRIELRLIDRSGEAPLRIDLSSLALETGLTEQQP